MPRYAEILRQRRWLVVAGATLLMLAMSAGVRYIGVTNDYRSLFDEDNPQLAALDALEATYGASNAALIAIAPATGSVFTREALGAIEELTEAAVARALVDPRRFAHELLPQRGVRRRPAGRAAR